VSPGFDRDGARLWRKVLGKAKTEVKDKLKDPRRGPEAMLVAGGSARRWCPVSNNPMAAPLSSSIA
jgi:hypothetical protein